MKPGNWVVQTYAGLLLAVMSCVAWAQTLPPEVARGVAWLEGQVQADGSLSGEASSLAAVLQARHETAEALGEFASPQP